ncbi:MAG TPA: phosphoribosyltransferase family protein [Hyphomicrobiaceae bacterium]|nr:phosphoribosyltransferase family protein [Hyphomicrobiaceae bacterium]
MKKAHPVFDDRQEAGRQLAAALAGRELVDPVVLALPRGGVPVAAEIARSLHAPLDLVLVRKIGVPMQPELAAAAVVDGGAAEIVTNDDVMAATGLTAGDIARYARRELAEIERRREFYLKGRERVPLDGRTIIVVDDGIATGASMRAALKALRRRNPRALILAVPVAAADTIDALRPEVDAAICLETPHPFVAIGLHYRDFHQLSDEDVIAALDGVHA